MTVSALALCIGITATTGTPAIAVTGAKVSEAQLVREARRCTQHFSKHERFHGIPQHLLAAIATTESGRYSSQLKMLLPWPWTANVEGQGYFYNSKREAVANVREFQRQGKKSIDVGCMQVNLFHHPAAFANLDQAFDPAYNVGYAARFLRINYLETGDWQRAASIYHSRTPSKGARYYAKVYDHWKKLSVRLKNGREQRAAMMASNDYSSDPLQEVAFLANLSPAAGGSVSPALQRPLQSINRIAVLDENGESKESPVLVIRPKTNSRAATSSAQEDDPSVKPIEVSVSSAPRSLRPEGVRPSTSSVSVIRSLQPDAVFPNSRSARRSSVVTGQKNAVFVFP